MIVEGVYYESNPQMNRPVREKPKHEASLWRHHPGVLFPSLLFFLCFGERSAIGALWASRGRNTGAMRGRIKFGRFFEDTAFVFDNFGCGVEIAAKRSEEAGASREEESWYWGWHCPFLGIEVLGRGERDASCSWLCG